MEIQWKDIDGYRGLYQVSNTGQIRSLPRKSRSEVKVLNPHDNGWGYFTVCLSNKGMTKTFSVAYLVTRAFLGNRPKFQVINHKDTNKKNNHIDNLEYIDPLENYNHAIKMGIYANRNGHRGSMEGKREAVDILLKAGFNALRISKVIAVHYRTVLRYIHKNNKY